MFHLTNKNPSRGYGNAVLDSVNMAFKDENIIIDKKKG